MEERKQKRNVSTIFYAVIGIITLVVSVIGATFAYFTATAANNIIKGDMAEIDFDIDVKKVTNADDLIGMIPMSNNMMERALTSSKGVCVDDNNNAVCQVYRITVVNDSTASMFLDGYVTLTGGSGVPRDFETVDKSETQDVNEREWKYSAAGTETTMRWAQVFCNTDEDDLVEDCSTGGATTARTDDTVTITALGGADVKDEGFNKTQIKSAIGDVSANYNINGNPYRVINRNYIRVSDRLASNTSYDREDDVTSALVYSQYINPNDNKDENNSGNSSSEFTDAQVYYIVVWLSETGTNQTASSEAALTAYFQGKVTFISSQGSEVTATFANHARVQSNT